MTPGGKVVDQSVSVQIGGKNVGSSRLPVGKKAFLQRSCRSGSVPEGEPLASEISLLPLAACDVGQAVPVGVLGAHVVGTARSILVGEDIAFPCLAGLEVVGTSSRRWSWGRVCRRDDPSWRSSRVCRPRLRHP